VRYRKEGHNSPVGQMALSPRPTTSKNLYLPRPLIQKTPPPPPALQTPPQPAQPQPLPTKQSPQPPPQPQPLPIKQSPQPPPLPIIQSPPLPIIQSPPQPIQPQHDLMDIQSDVYSTRLIRTIEVIFNFPINLFNLTS